MPVDHKRINGPETSEPYQLYSDARKVALKKEVDGIIKGNRSDGRKPNELRKIYMKTGVVTQAKGSAYIEVQRTKVIVSVFDPREIPNKNDYSSNGELYCEFKFATFSCHKRRIHQQDCEEKEFSVIMRRALESAVCRHEFPNFQVDIYAIVLENDGSALSAAITCAGLALAQAGVPMYDLVTAVTLARQGKYLFVDPTYNEESLCSSSYSFEERSEKRPSHKEIDHGTMTLSILSTHEQISELYQTGCFSLDRITESIQLLTELNQQIVPLVQKCLVSFVLKHIKEKKLEEEDMMKEENEN